MTLLMRAVHIRKFYGAKVRDEDVTIAELAAL